MPPTRTIPRLSIAWTFAILAAGLGMLPRVGCLCPDGTRLSFCSSSFLHVFSDDCDCSKSCCCCSDAREDKSPICPYTGQPCRTVVEPSDAGPLVEVTQAPEFDGSVVAVLDVPVVNEFEPAQQLASPLTAETQSASLITLGVMLRV